MALNLSTLQTNLDAVSDQIEAEQGTDAAYATAVSDVKGSAATITELLRCAELLQNLACDIGHGQPYQKDSRNA